MNVVAFGGGVAATLVLYLVHAVFEGRCVAVFVRLPGTTDEDWQRAQYLASFVGDLPTGPSLAPCEYIHPQLWTQDIQLTTTCSSSGEARTPSPFCKGFGRFSHLSDIQLQTHL